MYLPNGENAVVSIEKLRDYCLNAEHPVGKHKAKVFARVLGFTSNNASELQEILRVAASTQEAYTGEKGQYGQRYILDFAAVGASGSTTVRSVWIIHTHQNIPHLVTCYVN